VLAATRRHVVHRIPTGCGQTGRNRNGAVAHRFRPATQSERAKRCTCTGDQCRLVTGPRAATGLSTLLARRERRAANLPSPPRGAVYARTPASVARLRNPGDQAGGSRVAIGSPRPKVPADHRTPRRIGWSGADGRPNRQRGRGQRRECGAVGVCDTTTRLARPARGVPGSLSGPSRISRRAKGLRVASGLSWPSRALGNQMPSQAPEGQTSGDRVTVEARPADVLRHIRGQQPGT
jgi:hypothetical protein